MKARSLRPPLPSRPSWWLEEARAHRPTEIAPPLAGELDVDVAIVGGGYTGLWTALALREREPSLSVALLEAREIGDGPSGRNGGFLHGYWSSLPTLRRVLGDGAALQLAHASARIVPEVRAFCERRGEDVWLREGGLLRVSAGESEDAGVEHAVEAARELGVEEEAQLLDARETRRRCDSPRFRSAVHFRDGATVQPARLVLALKRAALDERCRALRAHARHRRPAREARDPGRRRPRARGRARAERVGHGLAARRPPDELRQRRRPHRARAGAARGDRLDGRRSDHRRAHVPPLLPHHARRARADGQRLGPARARRPRRPRHPRRRAGAGSRRARPARAPPRARRRADRGPLERPDRRLGRQAAALRHGARERGSTTAPATPATASGRAGSAGRSSPRWRSAPGTNGRRCRSSTARRGGCRPSRSATPAASSSAGAPWPPRRRSPRAGGRRSRHAPQRRSRACCGCRSGRGDWMPRRRVHRTNERT